jgi:hypothetical protein
MPCPCAEAAIARVAANPHKVIIPADLDRVRCDLIEERFIRQSSFQLE